jgi:hypothetical protein
MKAKNIDIPEEKLFIFVVTGTSLNSPCLALFCMMTFALIAILMSSSNFNLDILLDFSNCTRFRKKFQPFWKIGKWIWWL